MIFKPLRAAVLTAALLVSAPAFAAKGDIEAGRAKAGEVCAACHGEKGWSETEGVPNLAGNVDLFLQWQLVYFRNGRRPNEIMGPISETLSDADIRNLGAYYASLRPVDSPASADPKPVLTDAGKALIEQHRCANCHGDGFLGLRAAAGIANQREDYLVKALVEYRAARRPSAGVGAMNEAASSLSDDEIAAVAHYLARFTRVAVMSGLSLMRRMSWLALACVPALAHAAPLEDTHAFDRAFATSFYTFDACGDGKYGGLFRKALDARFAQCPFSPEARASHKRHNAMQAQKSRDRMNALIEQTGGVPMRLPGMEETCRQQRAEPDYAALRLKLERFSDGALDPDQVLAAPCDADEIAP